MPIPDLTTKGYLPDGVHDCRIEEIRHRFGLFRKTDRRTQLFAKLANFVLELQASDLCVAIIVDGSFTTDKTDPNDIDLLIVVRADHSFQRELCPAEYNLVSQRAVRRRYGFDILVAREGSREYDEWIKFFQQVRLEPEERKGILRVKL